MHRLTDIAQKDASHNLAGSIRAKGQVYLCSIQESALEHPFRLAQCE
jgi:hypothetical protein